jgi:hypothetical protein
MRFFSERLANRVPFEVMFWRDMLLFGTMANLAFLGIAVMLAAYDYPAWASIAAFLVPVPYNLFMWHCVWNGAGALATGARFFLRTIATCWLAIVLVV